MIKSFTLSSILFCSIFQNAFSQSDALSFNGSADYVEVVNADQLNIINNLTVEAWVQLDKIDGFNFILSKGFCGISEFGYAFSVADGKIRWAWNPDGNCNYTALVESANVVFNAGECHHLAVTHTNSYVKMYLDGIEIPAILMQGGYSNIHQSTEPFRVGIYRGLSGSFMYFMDGKIDEVKIWDAVRTQQQIDYSMNNALAGNENNLVLYYDFENLIPGSYINIPNKAIGSGSSLDGTSSVTSPLIETSCAILNNLNVTENSMQLDNNQVNVFPNPANSDLTIAFEKEVNNELIILHDAFGNVVKEINFSGIEANVDVTELSEGIYFLKVGNQVTKIVKNI
jgi:hypothetical protein